MCRMGPKSNSPRLNPRYTGRVCQIPKEPLMARHFIIGRTVIACRSTVFILALVLLGAGGCATDKKVMAVAESTHTGLNPAVMEDAELAAYLQKVGQRIVVTATEMDKQGYGPKTH